jgi:hypothetical protein
VSRSFGMIVVLLALALVGGLFAMLNESNGPSAAAVTQEEAQASAAAASAIFQQVTPVLQADYAQSGTYVGAELPLGSGVTLAQATATTYCFETTVNGAVVHEAGPGGSPADGPC